ncbi:carbonic anhydrase [Streptomyces orinoci]|uniref:carbonic anhydrase n=1 Tax=Streptomyces orinoci TaxID=67339 RepID=A0ABV3K1A4_STRON|nr:carbonic anhydrase [Streptomyces orinoci]
MADAAMPTPGQAFEMLLAGNHRFASGTPHHPNQDAARRAETAPGQRPFAVLFGCSDSRLAAEIIFDRGLGDLFVVRTLGHVVGAEDLGSIEFGVRVLGCPLVVVLGHDECGAVAAARATVEEGTAGEGYVRDVIDRVTPSVLAARAAGLHKDRDLVAMHVRRTVDLLLERSQILAEQVAAGRAAVVGMFYLLAGGTTHLIAARGLSADAAA